MPKATQRLLDDASFDLETWLAERIAEKFARAEANAFIAGTGPDKPKGILGYPTAPVATATDAQIGFVSTGASGDFAAAAPANALIDLVYALGAAYRANATFLMNSRVAGMVRKMRDGDGRYLWSDGLTAGEPARLLGYPVMISEDMPAPGASSKSEAEASSQVINCPDSHAMRPSMAAKQAFALRSVSLYGWSLRMASKNKSCSRWYWSHGSPVYCQARLAETGLWPLKRRGLDWPSPRIAQPFAP